MLRQRQHGWTGSRPESTSSADPWCATWTTYRMPRGFSLDHLQKRVECVRVDDNADRDDQLPSSTSPKSRRATSWTQQTKSRTCRRTGASATSEYSGTLWRSCRATVVRLRPVCWGPPPPSPTPAALLSGRSLYMLNRASLILSILGIVCSLCIVIFKPEPIFWWWTNVALYGAALITKWFANRRART